MGQIVAMDVTERVHERMEQELKAAEAEIADTHAREAKDTEKEDDVNASSTQTESDNLQPHHRIAVDQSTYHHLPTWLDANRSDPAFAVSATDFSYLSSYIDLKNAGFSHRAPSSYIHPLNRD